MVPGLQHVASRVANLTGFIERVNNYRSITGMGFSFLNIPRSYYGRLRASDIVKEGITEGTADAVVKALQGAGLVNNTGIVELSIDDDGIKSALSSLSGAEGAEVAKNTDALFTVVKRVRPPPPRLPV